MIYLFASMAGILSVLSPCVLPLLPVVFTGVRNEGGRKGPLILAAGLVVSFSSFGVLLSVIGIAQGVDPHLIRSVAAGFLVVAGILILFPQFNDGFVSRLERLTTGFRSTVSKQKSYSLRGMFLMGFMLGLVWAPCSGPALGAAGGLAVQSGSLPQALIIMVFFATGASAPLLLLAYSGQYLSKNRTMLRKASVYLQPMTGVALVLVGMGVLTGLDKSVETILTNSLPEWWIDLTTSF
jgi:cytochrome c biogenesis protein CcdA